MPIALTLLSVGGGVPAADGSAAQLVSYVDPFIGTGGKGKTYPGATVPHGMVQLSPDNGRNGWDWIAGYYYPDTVIAGFSHTHLSGTGAGDLYDVSFMPLVRPFRSEQLDDVNPESTVVSAFSHEREAASPGYYEVHLDTYNIGVRLTAALRSGYQEYTYADEHSEGLVKLDLGYSRNWDETVDTELTVLDDRTIGGYRKSTGWAKDQRVYFYTRFSRPMTGVELIAGGEPVAADAARGDDVIAVFEFDVRDRKRLVVETGISSVSVENARQNLLADEPGRGFEGIRHAAAAAWEQALSRVAVETDADNKRQFYTALYHTHLAPRVYSDVNGEYKGPDGGIHTADAGPRYSLFSLWDTFRALHPWKTITDQARTREMMRSLMAHYDEYGLLPVWNFQGNETDMMIGYHAVPVLADAYLKGLTDVDGERLLTAMKASAMQDGFGIDDYRSLGYVPHEHGKWNVSLTLEYAYDDWALAQVAGALGRDDDYRAFMRRAGNFRHHYDADRGFMRAKGRDGRFREPFDPLAYYPEDYCEANAWQYLWFVPHDVEALVALMGGPAAFAGRLDSLFELEQESDELPEWISGYIGQYVHGNEPSHHTPYLYQYVGQGHKTERRVRQIMDEYYSTRPDGLSGNEDAGQLSAWYLFSALGFYPVNPASGEYVFGSPQVDAATLSLENGREFVIVAENQSPGNVYVQSIRLNGRPVSRPVLRHDDIMAGGELVFVMSPEPATAGGRRLE